MLNFTIFDLNVISVFWGFWVSCLLGELATRTVVNRLYRKAELERTDGQRLASLWDGILEKFIYTSCIIVNLPLGIAAWLAFKAVLQWRGPKPEESTRYRVEPKIIRIGTALSLIFGVVGGIIARGGDLSW